jgi:hypothetical protein
MRARVGSQQLTYWLFITLAVVSSSHYRKVNISSKLGGSRSDVSVLMSVWLVGWVGAGYITVDRMLLLLGQGVNQ